ncbi:MAG TPA: DNA gyrase modulator, partial [Atribacterota bacterium]|nr:DNA gyrase modulator [Atribacterota bacterium]
MQDRLKSVLSKQRADYVEVRLEEYESTNIRFQGKDIDKISSSQEKGGNARALVKGRWGFVTFNRWEDLEDKVKQAVEIATLIGDEQSYLASMEPVVEDLMAEYPNYFREVNLKEKVALMKNYSNIITNFSSKIQSSIADYTDRYNVVHFANSEGTYIRQVHPYLSVHFTAIARDGDDVQMAKESIGTVKGYEQALQISSLAQKAAQ